MPGIRERDPNDTIKSKKGGRTSKEARRQLTAKFRKELAQRQRGDGAQRPDTQAVDDTEQVSVAAVEEVSGAAGHGITKGVSALQRGKAQKRQQAERRTTGAAPAREDTSDLEGAASDTAHLQNPQEQMRRKFLEERRELAPHPRQDSGALADLTHAPYYGNRPLPMEKDNRSLSNQSIYPSIKERPRRSANPREKPPGGAFTPKTRKQTQQRAQKAAHTYKAAVKGNPAAKRMTEQARRKFQREAQRNMLLKSRQTARRTAELSKRAALAVGKAVKAMVSALAALFGGGVLLAALCVILLIAAIIASPFGILFSNQPSKDAVPLSAAVAQVNMELAEKLADLQSGDYDAITIQGQPPDWREVVAVFAVKTAGAEDGIDVAALTPDRVERLRAVFWDMCAISAAEGTVEHPASGNTPAWTESVLTITITAKTAGDMRAAYAFDAGQNQTLTELLAELDALGGLLGDLSISQADAMELLKNLPAGLSEERRAVVVNACKLVGKVNYFWGGKSLVIGWDDRWGQLRKVSAAGSPTTGAYRPYGMDCSGFVDWAFYNATGGDYIIGHGGGARMQHAYCDPISWDEASPGDLVFYPEDTHVGIVGGRDEGGNLLIIHCASGQNNVVITGLQGFTSIGRPQFYGE